MKHFQTAATYAASAAPATSIVASAGPAYSYQAQYAAASALPAAASGAPAVAAAAYYPQASVAAGVTYTAGDSTNYQARPTYSHAHAQVAAMAARPIVTATTRPVSSYVPAPAYTSAYSSSAAYTPTTSYSYQHTTMPTTSYPPPSSPIHNLVSFPLLSQRQQNQIFMFNRSRRRQSTLSPQLGRPRLVNGEL